MATNATTDASKNVQVSAVITPETHAKLQELRWTQRVERTGDLIRKAIEEFIENHFEGESETPAKVSPAASSK